MKRKLFLVVLCFTVNFGYSQFTAIPDPNFESFLEANGMGDGIPNNGQVLTANIENVTDLVLPPGAGIIDLTGIEDFLSVEFLVFSSNPISSVNLSQNTALTTFGCANGLLTSLDLSNNTQLEWLSCQGNQLTSLLLNSENLLILECFDNGISSLDISQATSLTFLNCQQNSLSSLDVGQNTLLEELVCSTNGLSFLDMSNNPALTFLNCARTNIQSLDLSQNNNLTGLLGTFIEELIFLDLRNGNNANMSVDVRGTDDLQCIFVDDASASYLNNWFIDPFTTFVNNEADCDALGVASFKEERVVIYPNPTNEFIIVSIGVAAYFNIIDTGGTQLQTGSLREGVNRISISNLSSGLYFINVYTENGISTKKIIKK
jgi:Secretion system C-terminal sorting domain